MVICLNVFIYLTCLYVISIYQERNDKKYGLQCMYTKNSKKSKIHIISHAYSSPKLKTETTKLIVKTFGRVLQNFAHNMHHNQIFS